jgi:hypothetical protein
MSLMVIYMADIDFGFEGFPHIWGRIEVVMSIFETQGKLPGEKLMDCILVLSNGVMLRQIGTLRLLPPRTVRYRMTDHIENSPGEVV